MLSSIQAQADEYPIHFVQVLHNDFVNHGLILSGVIMNIHYLLLPFYAVPTHKFESVLSCDKKK